ncbi:hypothetical protein QYF61_022010 [Mycteria americana]|uniref:Uncharacterized protein n=1 Tax=Mycteria americana TaxID=33587 RepID=A0AAN7P9R3_MYCAM|nr:hypothetical protein QYF61_022010 [Mycteria americana]
MQYQDLRKVTFIAKRGLFLENQSCLCSVTGSYFQFSSKTHEYFNSPTNNSASTWKNRLGGQIRRKQIENAILYRYGVSYVQFSCTGNLKCLFALTFPKTMQ